MPVVRALWRDRAATWHAHGLNQLLYEPDTLARGMREVLMGDPPNYPVLVHKDEATSWFAARKEKTKRKSHRSLRQAQEQE
jgi:hypothetical protein